MAVPKKTKSDQEARAKALRAGDQSGERPAIRDELSGLLAHDLKTPLAAISMNLDFALAELRVGPSENLRSAIEDCREANLRAIRIVSDMAEAARLAAGDMEPTVTFVSVTRLLQEVVQCIGAQAAERRVRILWATDDSVVRADAGLLSKALERLIERALRHARAGSEVEIDQHGSLVTVRVETMADPAAEAATRSLALHYAESALAAQGGRLSAEAGADGALLYRIALPE